MATTPINFADLEQRYNLPRNLLQTVMMAESGGNPNAVSPKGAVGAFQFMPKTAQQYGIDPRDAVQSANAAAQMLSELSTKYKGDMPSVLAGYNWGQGNVDRKGLRNMPTETRNYIGKIMPKIQVASSGQSAIDSLPEGFTLDAPQGDIPPPPDGFTLDSLPDVTIRPDQMPQMPADAVSQQPDFYQRVGQDMLTRGQNVKNQIVQGVTGQQGWVETGANTLGNAAGLLWDVGAEGLKSAFGALPNAVQQPVKTAGRYVAESPVGVAGGEAITQAGEWAQKNPRASALVGSAFNLSGLPVAGKAAEATASVVKPIAEVTAERIAPVVQKATKLEPLNQDIVRQAGSNAYKYVKDTGTTFSPQGVNRILDVLESKRQKGSFGGKVITKEQAAINEAIDEFMPARGSVGTIDDIQTLDSQLGDKAAMAYTSGDFNKGRIFSNLQDDVRNALRKENTKVGDIIGSREGVDVLMNDAIPLWATQAKLGDIQKIIDRASVMDNPTTAIRTGFRNLMLNKNKFKQYPKEVQAMIKDAADTGAIDDLMGIAGSRLNAIVGGGAGGIKGAVIGSAVSKTARTVRDKMRMNRVNKIIDEMVKDVRPSVERFRNMPEAPKPKEPMRLLEYKPQQTDFMVDETGNARPMNIAEQAKANAARRDYKSKGLTPDVINVQAKNRRKQLMQKYGQSDIGRKVAENPDKKILGAQNNFKALLKDESGSVGSPEGFKQFIKLAEKSKSADDFIKSARDIKVSPDISKWFGEMYDEPTPKMAVEKFLQDIKSGKYKNNMGGTGAAIPLGAAGAGATYYQNQTK